MPSCDDIIAQINQLTAEIDQDNADLAALPDLNELQQEINFLNTFINIYSTTLRGDNNLYNEAQAQLAILATEIASATGEIQNLQQELQLIAGYLNNPAVQANPAEYEMWLLRYQATEALLASDQQQLQALEEGQISYSSQAMELWSEIQNLNSRILDLNAQLQGVQSALSQATAKSQEIHQDLTEKWAEKGPLWQEYQQSCMPAGTLGTSTGGTSTGGTAKGGTATGHTATGSTRTGTTGQTQTGQGGTRGTVVLNTFTQNVFGDTSWVYDWTGGRWPESVVVLPDAARVLDLHLASIARYMGAAFGELVRIQEQIDELQFRAAGLAAREHDLASNPPPLEAAGLPDLTDWPRGEVILDIAAALTGDSTSDPVGATTRLLQAGRALAQRNQDVRDHFLLARRRLAAGRAQILWQQMRAETQHGLQQAWGRLRTLRAERRYLRDSIDASTYISGVLARRAEMAARQGTTLDW